jgi:hypothetical protein
MMDRRRIGATARTGLSLEEAVHQTVVVVIPCLAIGGAAANELATSLENPLPLS